MMQPFDKKKQILHELDEDPLDRELIKTMEQLDRYKLHAPSEADTKNLIAFLKPTFAAEQLEQSEVNSSGFYEWLNDLFRLLQPQAALLSKPFMLVTMVLFFLCFWLTGHLSGNQLVFLTNGSPLLGILTVFYEFRARQNKMAEMEAVCLYTPAQIATARLVVVLGYTIIISCLAMPMITTRERVMVGEAVLSWLGPLFFILGVNLAASLRWGVTGGMILAMALWVWQLAAGKGEFLLRLLLPQQAALWADCLGCIIGIVLAVATLRRGSDLLVGPGEANE
ncbi:MAG: hypothetical protein E6713_05425 [Sporomusaceae bacterium]|nr:hypothetical protein [Sporomusaceae bacterium]